MESLLEIAGGGGQSAELPWGGQFYKVIMDVEGLNQA